MSSPSQSIFFNECHGFAYPIRKKHFPGDSLKPIPNLFFRSIKKAPPDRLSPALRTLHVAKRVTNPLDSFAFTSLFNVSKQIRQALRTTSTYRNLEEKLKRYSNLLNLIPGEEKPLEIKGIACTVENFATIKNYLKARDKLIVWKAVAKQAQVDGAPDFSQLQTLEKHSHMVSKFEGWINDHPDLQNLKTLNLSGKNLSSIPHEIGKLSRLQALNLTDNQITKIEGLENLSQLKELRISKNQITKIEGLENLSLLKELWFYNNLITKIEGLGELSQLTSLSLSDNQITKIEGLENLSLLKTFGLRNNQITKIEGLENLSLLKWLYLHNNQITKVEGLENLSQLKLLYLEGNQITNFYEEDAIPPGCSVFT